MAKIELGCRALFAVPHTAQFLTYLVLSQILEGDFEGGEFAFDDGSVIAGRFFDFFYCGQKRLVVLVLPALMKEVGADASKKDAPNRGGQVCHLCGPQERFDGCPSNGAGKI